MKRLTKIVRVRLTQEQIAFLKGKNTSQTIRLALESLMQTQPPF